MVLVLLEERAGLFELRVDVCTNCLSATARRSRVSWYTFRRGLGFGLLILPLVDLMLAACDLLFYALQLRIVVQIQSTDDLRTRDIVTLGSYKCRGSKKILVRKSSITHQ